MSKENDGYQSLLPSRELGGHVADVTTAFTMDGVFLLVPRGKSVMVVGSLTGKIHFTVKGLHAHAVVSILAFDLSVKGKSDKVTRQICITLDTNQHILMWELVYEKSDGDPKFRTQSIGGFNLFDLDLPNPIDQNMDDKSSDGGVELTRRSVANIHLSRGYSKSIDSASLIIVIETRIISPSIEQQIMAEVVEIPISLFMSNAAVNPTWLFCFGYESKVKLRGPHVHCIRSAIGQLGQHIAVSVDKQLCIWSRSAKTIIELQHTDTITSISIQPENRCVATGDELGRTLWWHALDPSLFLMGTSTPAPRKANPKPSLSDTSLNATNEGCLVEPSLINCIRRIAGEDVQSLRRHIAVSAQQWHPHIVKSLAYTPDGTELITAGEEGVLVLWHTHQGTRRFLPKFGGPIQKIEPCSCNTLVAVSLANNSVKVIDISTGNISAVYQGIRVPLSILQLDSMLPISLSIRKNDVLPICLQPLSGEHSNQMMITGSGVTHAGLGSNSTLQVYDLKNDFSLGTVTVNRKNHISRPDRNPKMYQWTVQKVAVSPDCTRLATVEFRESMFRSIRKKMAVALGDNLSMDRSVGVSEPTMVSEEHNEEDAKKRVKIGDDDVSAVGTYDDRVVESGRLYTMKFWDIAIDQNMEHELVTTIECPHVNDITSFLAVPMELSRPIITMKDSPVECDFVSGSLDSMWRIWRRQMLSDRDGKITKTYVCIHTGTFRSLPVLDMVLSSDSSVMAVGHATCISLWGSSTRPRQHSVSGETFIDILPLPRVGPEVDELKLSWIESSYQSSEDDLRGELLLLSSTGSQIFLWDLKLSQPTIVWFHRFDVSPTILKSNGWGLPIFVIVDPSNSFVRIYKVQRNALDEINCPLVNSFSISKRIIGFSPVGSAENPEIAILDREFQMYIFTLNERAGSDETVANATTSDCNGLTLESDSEDEENQETDEAYKTSFLSEFLMQSRPATSATDVLQIQKITGQSFDGPSQFAVLPSVIFYNMMDAYLPRKR